MNNKLQNDNKKIKLSVSRCDNSTAELDGVVCKADEEIDDYLMAGR